MAKASLPLPDEVLSPGVYETDPWSHPLFSDDLDVLDLYAEFVLIRHDLPSPGRAGVFDRDQEGRITCRRLAPDEPEGAGSVKMLDGETLAAWIKQETERGTADAWEVAYAYAFIDRVAVVRNDERLANSALDKECRDRRASPGYPDAGVTAFKSAFRLGREFGELMARWRIFWRHGEAISRDHPKPLRELLWSIVVNEELEAEPRDAYPLAEDLAKERDLGTELGMKLRAAGAPTPDRMGRHIADLRRALYLYRPVR